MDTPRRGTIDPAAAYWKEKAEPAMTQVLLW
jgi:hypothetical protein